MDRKKGAGSPPGELGSFDLAKMGEAEVAAVIAARMAQWRRARKRPDAPSRGPSAAQPAVGQQAARHQTPPPEPDAAVVARIDRALRMAADGHGPQTEKTRSGRLTSAYRTDFRALLAEGPNMNAAGMRPAEGRIGQMLRRARAIGVAAWHVPRRGPKGRIDQALGRACAIRAAAWHAPMHWPLIASTALAAAAFAGWILMPLERAVAPEVASAPKVAIPPVAIHPPDPAPAIAGPAGKPAPAPKAQTPTRQEAIPPDKLAAPAPAPPRLEWHGPTLAARLKPAKPAAVPAKAKSDGQATKRPDTHQQDAAPLSATPQAPQALGATDHPHRMEQ